MLGGASGAIPPPPADSSMLGGGAPSTWQKATSNNAPLGNNPLDLWIKGSRAVNAEAQDTAGRMAEKAGRDSAARGENPSWLGQAVNVAPAAALATLSEANPFLPQNRLAAGLSLIGPAVNGVKALAGVPDMLKGALGASEAAPAAERGLALQGGKVVAGEEVPAAAAAGARPVGGTAGTAEPLATEAPGAAMTAKGPVPNKPGFRAQVITGMAGRNISPGVAQYAIDNPGVLDSAKSIEEANKNYADQIPGLKGKVQSLADRINKIPGSADFDESASRGWRLLRGTEVDAAGNKVPLTPQSALESLQSINQMIRDKAYTSQLHTDKLAEILKTKDGLMDFMQNNGSPGLRAAAKDLFEAHVKDAFSDLLPRNKFGSTDALRTIAGASGLGKAGAVALAGHPVAALPMAAGVAAMSPRFWGGVIKNVAAIPAAASMALKAAPAAANYAGEEPAPAPAPAPPPAQSPALIANILRSNTLNPGKRSDPWNSELSRLGLPSDMVSASGKNSINKLASILHEKGLIPNDDEGLAVQYLKSISGKMK